jgi:hypothetical protein
MIKILNSIFTKVFCNFEFFFKDLLQDKVEEWDTDLWQILWSQFYWRKLDVADFINVSLVAFTLGQKEESEEAKKQTGFLF